MRVEQHDDYTLVIGWAAPGAAATTIGSVIFIEPDRVDDAHLLRHEREHITQWRRYGYVGFLRRYLGDYFRWRLRFYPHKAAYRRIAFEVEAEWAARLEVPRR